jgi:hypothetical protein
VSISVILARESFQALAASRNHCLSTPMIFELFNSGEALKALLAPKYLYTATIFVRSECDFLGEYFMTKFALELSMICEYVRPFKVSILDTRVE